MHVDHGVQTSSKLLRWKTVPYFATLLEKLFKGHQRWKDKNTEVCYTLEQKKIKKKTFFIKPAPRLLESAPILCQEMIITLHISGFFNNFVQT